MSNNLTLTLKLTRKDKNSPILSIQNFIYRHILYDPDHKNNKSKASIFGQWLKYSSIESNESLIKNHKLTYSKFKEIAENVYHSIEPYDISIQPNLDQNSTKTLKLQKTNFTQRMI
jgi:hypothetical protein